MIEIFAVYCTFPAEEEARQIGRDMIERDLAACINILGSCHSIYRWQGAIETSEEVAAIFKTSAARLDRLIAAIAAGHSYDVPAITSWPIARAGPGYAEWVEAGQAPGFG